MPEWSFGVNWAFYRKMVLVSYSYIHVLLAAFFMGLAAAVPMGPVNMLAIRRGVIGGWRHTLACGIGSVTSDLILFSLVLLGGDYFLPDLSNPTLRTVLAGTGAIVLLPLGIYFLVCAVKEPLWAYASARQHWAEGTVPGHLVAEIADAAALTIFNPLTIAYWVTVTSNWLPFAHSVLGYSAPAFDQSALPSFAPSAIIFSTSSAVRGSFALNISYPLSVISTSSSIRTPRFSSGI